ncbi:MAG: ankyrin repeat domain-containing protein, partial [Candidatus Sericytochromatia bacterium]
TGEDNKGFTPLMLSCQNEKSSKEIVELLISKGADLNSVVTGEDNKGFTPLMFACKNGNKEIVELLLSKGSDVNFVSKGDIFTGYTSLIFASRNGNKEIVELLLSKGADINVVDTLGYTALMYSCENGNKEIVELLISRGADVNSVVTGEYDKGYTPLMFACESGNKEIVELLISKGADINSVVQDGDYKGYTPLGIAYKNSNKEIFSFLMSKSNDNTIFYFKSSLNLLNIYILKSNIHYFQTIIETYSVDFGGIYPEKIEELQKEAKSKDYWKDIKNPFTQMIGVGKNGAIMDYKIYKNYKPHPSLKGLVLYEAIDSKFDKVEKKSFCTKYKIYATDENGDLLKEIDGKVFYLTNTN